MKYIMNLIKQLLSYDAMTVDSSIVGNKYYMAYGMLMDLYPNLPEDEQNMIRIALKDVGLGKNL